MTNNPYPAQAAYMQPPAVQPDPEVNKKKKKKTLLILLIVFGSILVVGLIVAFILLWYWRGWFFAPTLQTDAFAASQITDFEHIQPPSSAQTEAIQTFVQELATQNYHRMDLTERKGAEQLEIMTRYLSTGKEPDLAAMFAEMGIDIKDSKGNAASNSSLAARPILLNADGTVSLGEESGEMSAADGEVAGTAEGLNMTLPAESFHSTSKIRLTTKEKLQICPACQKKNAADATVCEYCGTLLTVSDQEVQVDVLEPTGDAGGGGGAGPSEAQLESMMLSNLSATLLLANRPTTAYYLACLACMRDPGNVSAIVSLVTHLRMHDGNEEALLICIHGLEMDPNREELYVHAGNILIQLDKPDEALSYLNQCIKVRGYSGPAYQAAMFAYMQKKDYANAFRCMLEGARDGYTSSIRVLYDFLRLSPDYWDFAGKTFEKYTVTTLMDFSMNRSGFNPANELADKVVDIGACKVPYSPEDWIASAKTMIEQAQKYLSGAVEFYKEDIEEIAAIYNILLNSGSLEDLAKGFMSKFGDKLLKHKLSEAERVVSYEQEVFWLDILDDYREWKVNDIRKKIDEELDGKDLERFFNLMDKYLKETQEKLETLDWESIEGLTYALNYMMERVQGNQSIAFTAEQSESLTSIIVPALRANATVRNKAYQEIADVLRGYYMYSNAILGMIADDDLYREYRTEMTMNVTQDQGLCVVENCFFAYCVPILAEPYLLIGKSAQEGITEGALTGGCPAYPKYVISNKAARPSVDMSGDIEIPDIGAITNKVLGVDLEHQVGDPGNNNYPALSKIWEMAWREANPDFIGPAPNPPDFNDSYERTKFWNSLTPEQRVRYSAMVADPNVTKKAIVLDLYCARGQSAVHFSEEKIDLLSGVGTSVGVGNLGLEFGADGKVEGKVSIGIGSIAVDNRNNISVTMKDKVSGLKFGVKKTGRDLTAYTGTDAGFNLLGKTQAGSFSSETGGFGAKVSGMIYTTYSLAKGQVTSGGIKSGASFLLGGLLGFGTSTNVNLVQGISTQDIFLIINGSKLNLRIKQDYNYEDTRTDKDIPGIQEFHG